MLPRAKRRPARTHSLTLPTMGALGGVMVVVAGMFAALLLMGTSLDATAKSGRRAALVLQEADQLERAAVDMGTGVRGYLLTGDRGYLAPYDAGRRAVATH